MDLLNYNFKDYNGNNLESDIDIFIVKFCEYNHLLDKRVNKLWSSNPSLRAYCDRDDIKQEIILALLTKARKKFPYITGKDRLKYFNTVV